MPDNLPEKKFTQPGLKTAAMKLLWAILSIAVLVALWQRTQLGFRAGHMDEYDYLFVAKTLLADLQWPTHTYIFGSNLSWYLYGWGDSVFGGLEGARVIAAVLGLLSLLGVYLFSNEVWQSKRVALVATLLMGVAASHIFISRLASYDAVSFTFFSLAMMPLLRSCRPKASDTSPMRYAFLVTGILLLLGAVLTKYTTAAYLPFIGLFMLITAPVTALIGGAILAMGLGAYLTFHWTELLVLYQVQISGTHGANTTYTDILYRSAYYVGLPLAICLFASRKGKHSGANNSHTRILGLLVLFASPLFLYHLHGQNLISLYKHLNFSLYFLACGAAWYLVKTFEYYVAHYFATDKKTQLTPVFLAALLGCYTLINAHQLEDMESGYPDLQGLLTHLQKESPKSSSTILSEDPYLFRYLAFNETPQEQIRETGWLDNDQDGVHSHQDVLDALWDRKFDTIFLTDAIHPHHNIEYRKILSQRGYVQLYEEPYELSTVMTTNNTGKLTLYRRSVVAATADQ